MKRLTNDNILILPLFLCLLLLTGLSYGQQPNNQKDTLIRKNFNIFQFAINALSHIPEDSAKQAAILNIQSEAAYLPYSGKIIRHIIIQQFGFEKTFLDTAKSLLYQGSKILNSLHRNTSDQVIRNNLFIKENTLLNAYKVADNERYLRSLEYIQDTYILVKAIEGETDSVDV